MVSQRDRGREADRRSRSQIWLAPRGARNDSKPTWRSTRPDAPIASSAWPLSINWSPPPVTNARRRRAALESARTRQTDVWRLRGRQPLPRSRTARTRFAKRSQQVDRLEGALQALGATHLRHENGEVDLPDAWRRALDRPARAWPGGRSGAARAADRSPAARLPAARGRPARRRRGARGASPAGATSLPDAEPAWAVLSLDGLLLTQAGERPVVTGTEEVTALADWGRQVRELESELQPAGGGQTSAEARHAAARDKARGARARGGSRSRSRQRARVRVSNRSEPPNMRHRSTCVDCATSTSAAPRMPSSASRSAAAPPAWRSDTRQSLATAREARDAAQAELHGLEARVTEVEQALSRARTELLASQTTRAQRQAEMRCPQLHFARASKPSWLRHSHCELVGGGSPGPAGHTGDRARRARGSARYSMRKPRWASWRPWKSSSRPPSEARRPDRRAARPRAATGRPARRRACGPRHARGAPRPRPARRRRPGAPRSRDRRDRRARRRRPLDRAAPPRFLDAPVEAARSGADAPPHRLASARAAHGRRRRRLPSSTSTASCNERHDFLTQQSDDLRDGDGRAARRPRAELEDAHARPLRRGLRGDPGGLSGLLQASCSAAAKRAWS